MDGYINRHEVSLVCCLPPPGHRPREQTQCHFLARAVIEFISIFIFFQHGFYCQIVQVEGL